MNKIVLASGNAKKRAELEQILAPLAVTVLPQTECGVPEVEETGLTFVENAILKARNACHHTGLPALADDSGLEVDALKGAPGIYSARFSGAEASDAKNNALLIEMLANVPPAQRSARYHAVIVFMRHEDDPVPLICQGQWEGRIVDQPQGDQGFGYDPHFFVPEKNCTAAQLPPHEKNRLSHRGVALQKLMTSLRHILSEE